MSQAETEAIARAIEQEPDITLNELIEKLELPIRKSQLSRLLIKLGYSVKKKRSTRKASSGRTSSRSARSGGKCRTA
jgi:transposase